MGKIQIIIGAIHTSEYLMKEGDMPSLKLIGLTVFLVLMKGIIIITLLLLIAIMDTIVAIQDKVAGGTTTVKTVMLMQT
jgi:hypothetical protein